MPIESMTDALAKRRLCQTGGAAFMAERAPGPERRKGLIERAGLCCGMGSIRHRGKRNGGLPVLRSLACERFW
jgi:hypothetical protein